MTRPAALIIQDIPSELQYTSRMFGQKGWPVIESSSCKYAVEKLGRQALSFVLVDLYLEKEPALEFIPLSKKMWSETPVVAVGFDNWRAGSELAKASRAGADILAVKPFNEDVINTIIADVKSFEATGRRRVHCLVVDDSRTVRTIISRSLAEGGLKVSSVQSSEESLARLDAEPVDVVIIDIFMPGIGGINGIRAIRKNWPGVAIIAMSGGVVDAGDHESALKAAEIIGADYALRKPFSAAQLQAAVRTAMAARQGVRKPAAN